MRHPLPSLPSRSTCAVPRGGGLRRLAWATAALALLAAGALPGAASALPLVRLAVLDLTDPTPGEDLWRLEYEIEGFGRTAGHGLSILFEPALYRDLVLVGGGGDPAWDALVLQPDPALPDYGLLDLLALVDAPGTGGPFAVEAVWLGAGAPGSQPFGVYGPDFQPLPGEQGETVPEPVAGVLLLAGALALAGARRRARMVACLAAIGLAATGCLPTVEHRVDLGDFELVYEQVEMRRVDRLDFEYEFAARLEPKVPLATAAPRVVTIATTGAGSALVEDTLVFPATAGAPVEAEAPFVLRQDRSFPFEPGALAFALVSEAAPALAASAPEPGAVAPISAWPTLAFDAAVPTGALAGFALACDGAPHPVTVTPLPPERVILNPAGDLPAEADCELAWPGPGGALAFSTGTAGTAIVRYDRRDRDVLPPFPDDVHLVPDASTPTGWRVSWPPIERPLPAKGLADALLAVPNTLDGWSPLGAVVVPLSQAPDPASLPTEVADSLDPAATVGLYDIDPDSPEYGERIPFDLSIRSTKLGSEPSVHQIVLYPGRPLAERTRYGFVMSRRVLAADGTPYGASSFFQQALGAPQAGEDATVARARTLSAEVLAALEEAATVPVPAEDTVLALSMRVRSTHTIPEDVLALRDDVEALPAAPSFTIDSVRAGSGDVAAIAEGTWEIPNWLNGSNYLQRDGNGVPQLVGTVEGPFTLALPHAAEEGPVPLTMYQHGNPGSAPNEVPGEARDYLAGAGFATIGFTDTVNREYADVQAQFIGIFLGLLTNHRIAELYTQTYGEQMAFIRLIQENLGSLDLLPLGAPDGVPDLDPGAPLTYVGISYGGVHGAALVPYEPEIRAAALVAGGGGFGERLFYQDETDPLGQGSFFRTELPAIVTNIRAEDFWVGLQLLQMGYDAQDPNNHALYTYRNRLPIAGTTRKASVLIMEGIADSFSTGNATRSQAWSTGPVPQLDPVEEDVPYLPEVQGEATANVDPETSAALVQYVPAGHPELEVSPGCETRTEGHYCVQGARDSELQRAAFFRSAVEGGPPRILSRTLDTDGDGLTDLQELYDGSDPESPLSP